MRLRQAFTFGLVFLLCCILVEAPSAVVTQVDGVVVPLEVSGACPRDQDNCIQTGLNFGEGVNPPEFPPVLPGPIRAVLDANTGPETFLVPQTGTAFNSVIFRLVQEGAGYENIFGWYNVEDPSKRYPVIFSCRGGNRGLYEPPYYDGTAHLVGGYVATVDFQAEATAGRYLGKQIGFYIITPEGTVNAGLATSSPYYNCATDPSDQGVLPGGTPINDDNFVQSGQDDTNGFGRLYYTESKLNNDGNFVHYLIYQSAKNAQHFYFGFEDLFRGGDNDYDDILVKVEGLVPTCQPKQEVCNGEDDNCNGRVDENLSRSCSTACGTGQETCQFTNDGNPNNDWVGCTAPQPKAETCNGLDDDCNGTPDDNVPSGGACVNIGCTGQLICTGGVWLCNAPSPTNEVCDGKDNDCNGQTDDLTRPCATACGTGVESCLFKGGANPNDDWANCTAPQPKTETCNGLDDDCNNQVDDNVPSIECSNGDCKGQTYCLGGNTLCDAPTPSTEVCDGKDNNCNGQTDEGLVRICMTACGLGTETCQFVGDGDPNHDWINCTASLPQQEVCDGVDNDCNGKVDDNVAGEGVPCDAPTGTTCKQGTTKCVAGQITCVGATTPSLEVCDCKDNNCNGQIDEEPLEVPCPQGSKCVDCGCRIPCTGTEFGCPVGYSCKNGYCMPDSCAGVVCADGERCQGGICVSLCQGVQCSEGKVCQRGLCVEDNCYGKGCPAGQYCHDNQCQPDPCAGVTCATGEFCDHGTCKKSCGATMCGSPAVCVAGECRSDPCAGVVCQSGVVCLAGRCDEACRDVSCPTGHVCRAGACIENPCTGVRCFGADETCQDGQCVSPRTFAGSRTEVLAVGGGGLTCQVPVGAGGPAPLLPALLLALSVLLLRRGRLAFLLAVPVALALSGCTQDPMALVNTGDASFPEAGIDTTCVPSNEGVEICDGLDNDCNGRIDDGFNLLSDPAHCGSCTTSCQKRGALSVCENGVCRDLGCAPGFLDLNRDASDGCEYECTPSGAEVCDGKDNDCNGQTDEIFDLQKDVSNCGSCGNICQLAHAVPKCEAGKCKIQNCATGYIDKDKDDSTGCEAPCTVSNGGVEICDGLDNDCNGVVDDPGGNPINFDTDAYNCGGCDVVCAFSNGVSACQAKKCVMTGCTGTFVDADKQSANGCECLPDGIEVCDGKDNDCNGVIDDHLTDLGPCGSMLGICTPGVLVCQNGILACTGASGPQPEVCDGIDNDCSGVPDDNMPSLGICGISKGECKTGVNVCQNGAVVCQGAIGVTAEICDGKDNDCNGAVDDNMVGYPGTCGSSVGECKLGQQFCLGGVPTCQGAVDPTPEMCDGKDNDCDSQNDPAACLWPGSGREKRLDQLSASSYGVANSVQLHVAGREAHMLAVWLDRRNGDHGDVYAQHSSDGGRTWLTADIGVATDSSSRSEPHTAFGGPSAGGLRAYIAYEQFDAEHQRDLYLRRSTDSGATWSSPVLVERVNTGTRDALFARLAVRPGATAGDADAVAVCWESIALNGPINPNIRCNLSLDSGQTFTQNDVQVNATANNAFVPEIAIDSNNVYVAWQQGSLIRTARAALSLPLTFNSETALSTQPGQDPQIAADGLGTVLVVWEDLRDPLIAIRANRSSNFGQSWMADGAKLDLDVVDGDSIAPSIAMRPGGRVFVAWQDTSRGAPNIYANYSDDGGMSWSAVARRVDSGGSAPGATGAENPKIAVAPNNNNVYVTWEDYRNGSKRDIYATLSLDNGVTWTHPDFRINESMPAGAADARAPTLWPSPGRLGIVWMDNRAGTAGALTTGSNADIWSSYLE